MHKCTIASSTYKPQCNDNINLCIRHCGSKDKNGLLKYSSFDKQRKDQIKNYLKSKCGSYCKICGKTEDLLLDDFLQIEHIFPQNKEFLSDDNDKFLESCLCNFILVCPRCNNKKRDEHVTQNDYDIIFNYNINNDYRSHIDESGLVFHKEEISILLYYNLEDEYNLAMEYSLISELSSAGISRYVEKETNKYIKNTLEMRNNEILY